MNIFLIFSRVFKSFKKRLDVVLRYLNINFPHWLAKLKTWKLVKSLFYILEPYKVFPISRRILQFRGNLQHQIEFWYRFFYDAFILSPLQDPVLVSH